MTYAMVEDGLEAQNIPLWNSTVLSERSLCPGSEITLHGCVEQEYQHSLTGFALRNEGNVAYVRALMCLGWACMTVTGARASSEKSPSSLISGSEQLGLVLSAERHNHRALRSAPLIY